MTQLRTGFTLIEVLIVIAIVGILAAVLIPNLLGARGKAVVTGAAAYARNCATSATRFSLENPSADIRNLDCVTLGAGTRPSYVTVAQVNATSNGITYTYDMNGAPKTEQISLELQ
ncbi:type II secretion system protein [Deinococcus pimensis]|uniref:type II secretion system protein n=1 Tax=Deinococcus pimensis TaxID=309888 RepID=UPI0004B8A0CD|nr:type II secretion system protein [Deinococcus pimensis]